MPEVNPACCAEQGLLQVTCPSNMALSKHIDLRDDTELEEQILRHKDNVEHEHDAADGARHLPPVGRNRGDDSDEHEEEEEH